MPDTPPKLNGLRHLALVVEDLEACEDFYRNILGMEVLVRANDNLVYLTLGNDNLSLGRARPGGPAAPVRRPMDHFGFIVDTKDDLQAWFEFMQEKGVNLLDAPSDHFDGARSFHCTDPAGNVIQPIYHPALSGQVFTGP